MSEAEAEENYHTALKALRRRLYDPSAIERYKAALLALSVALNEVK